MPKPSTTTPVEETSKHPQKRKRLTHSDEAELAIDIAAPEPLSKRQQRLAKKGRLDSTPKIAKEPETRSTTEAEPYEDNPAAEETHNKQCKDKRESSYGIWIGNLPWTATRDSLRSFFAQHAGLVSEQITRIHMPPPDKAAVVNTRVKPHNKGFAYVDFTTAAAVQAAIDASETLMGGRAVLIKDAGNFDQQTRPKAADDGAGNFDGDEFKMFSKTAAVQAGGGKTPNRRVFIGNLSFDITDDDLIAHYSKCGHVTDVFMATFEDTGKCKGYAWVTFETLDSAAAAVAGYTMVHVDRDGAGKEKIRKHFLNKINNRELRVEYAEDASTRYKKRFGKERDPCSTRSVQDNIRGRNEPRMIDARKIKPGAALANAPRASAAIVASQGRKVAFD